jgi:hypothetical protein
MNRRSFSMTCLVGALASFVSPLKILGDTAPDPLEEVSLLKRRQIEALIAVPMIKGYEQEMGATRAREKAAEIITQIALKSGEQMADEIGGRTIPLLARVVKEVWCREKALIIEVLEESEEKFSFNVTRCGYADQYEKLGIKEYGPILSCLRDEAFVQGFNPRIGFKRTRTIMHGALSCDFRFEIKPGVTGRS